MTEVYVSNKDNLQLTMELLGEILHFSKSGRLIIKVDQSSKNYKAGSQIYADGERKIGKIAELIGPTGSPYASAIPFIQTKGKLVGTKVYTSVFFKNSKAFKTKKPMRRNKK